MTGLSSYNLYNTTIRNIQSSFEELTRLQNQLQTQKLLQKPSEDPVTANQAIRLERNLNEVTQYKSNVETGSDYLLYSDQILSQMEAPINNAIEKASQALNAEMTPTALRAIGQEIQSVLDSIISIANTTLGDKSIFGGNNYTGDAFEFVGSDVLFKGNNEIFNINVFGSERIQANITADQAFGARGTILDSERNLAPAIPPLSIKPEIEIDETKTINKNVLKVTARQTAINMYNATGNSATVATFTTALDTALGLDATYTDNQAFSDAIRDAAATGLGAASANVLTTSQTVAVTKVVDAATNIYTDSTNDLVLQEGDNLELSKLDVTLTTTNTTDTNAVIKAINAAVANVAGKDANGAIDLSNIKINAKLATIRAFSDVSATDAQGDALATSIDTINGTLTTTTTSNDYANQVETAAYTALGVTKATASATQISQAETAKRAARNAYAEIEFTALKTRQGLVITHNLADQVSIDEGSTEISVINDLELGGRVNSHFYNYSKTPTATNLAADRTLTLTSATGAKLEIALKTGDSTTTIASRINKAVNAFDVDESLRTIVASENVTSTTTNSLELTSDQFFKVHFDNTTEFASESATSYVSLKGSKNSIEDLRGGIGIRAGNHKIIPDNVTTGFVSNVHVRAGDSIDYIIEQLNNLDGFYAEFNSEKNGVNLTNTSLYSTGIKATETIGSKDFTITADAGLSKTITFAAATDTYSEMAAEINAKSSASFRFHAAVNSTGDGLVLTSNEKFSAKIAETTLTSDNNVVSSSLTDHTSIGMISSTLLNGLGLSATPTSTGLISGQDILQNQVKLVDINDGDGFTKGSLRFTINSVNTDVDFSSASTMRDIKLLIEKAMPGQLTVDLNASQNGLRITSSSSSSIKIQELNNGSVGRRLGLIQPPNNSVSGTVIDGNAITPSFNSETLLKNLNNGAGVDPAGFIIQNGDRQTTITFDTDGDGINDVRTVQEMINHINQKSKQDNVFIEASLDTESNKIKIVSKLSNTDLQIKENPVSYPIYVASGISGTSTDAATLIANADGTKSITVDLTGSTKASEVVSKINAQALTADFQVKARIADDGSVEIVSNEQIRVSDSALTYTTEQYVPNPPVTGSTAADLGLLGAFSNKTLLTSLNNGNGIEYGTFNLKYGSHQGAQFYVDNVASTAHTLTFYNENGSISNNITLTGTLDTDVTSINNNAALTAMGISAEKSTTTGGGIRIYSSNRFSMTNVTTPTTTYKTNYQDSSFTTAAKTVNVDLEFASTLEDVKNAIETASQNEILVSFGESNRIELRLASGDVTQRIEVSEIDGSSNVAGTLGLTSSSIIKGRELKNGITDNLTMSTKLSEIGININLSANAQSTENAVTFQVGSETITIDMTSANTVGNIISRINQTIKSDQGSDIKLEAKIEDGKYITVKNVGGSPLIAVRSNFSEITEKLGLIPDSSLTNDITLYSENLTPLNLSNNFFSALTVIRDQLLTGSVNVSTVSASLQRLESIHEQFLQSRAEAGARIGRFETLKTRFEEEEVNLQSLLGEKTTIDIIEVTQKFLAQQQIYESALSSTSRILGTSLFSFL